MMRGNQQSTTTLASLRPIGMPRNIDVRVDADGLPITVTRTVASRRTVSTHIESIEDIWQISEAWWREGTQNRTYYRVILDGDRPLTLFRDDVTGTWAEQPYTAPNEAMK